ncbi:MAG: molybdate ABC transporter substrate-binding protein [Microbacteriaceae bacterium]|nr:MAG: molybdate ABC transporter substrate-binding protein [Microbacteriaceae bacterium]
MIGRGVRVLAAVAGVLLLAGCASGQSGSSPAGAGHAATSSHAADALSGDLTIYAAASLTASFNELAAAFEKANPGVTVKPIDYDGSSTLATQLIQGAPVDVFASADQATMDEVSSAGLLDGSSTVFARNALEIAVQPGNPRKITGLSDLANPKLQVVLCAPQVPCGTASHTLLDADGIAVRPVSEEQNVTAVITKVKSGNADAGLVYVTDVKAASSAVAGVKIPDADKAVNKYPIAALKAAPNPTAAAAFVQFVLSPAGQKVLAGYGFAAP